MQTSRGYEFMGVNPPSFPSIPPHSNAPVIRSTKDVSSDIMSLFNKLLTKRYTDNINTDDDNNGSIIAECIKIRDDTMTCGSINQCDANDTVVYLTTMQLNFRSPHVLYFWCF